MGFDRRRGDRRAVGPVDSMAMTTSGSAPCWGRSVVLMAGADPKGHPTGGAKPGDVIHEFQSGSIQSITDAAIDPAGNVWAANNWNDPVAATSDNPNRATSTWGGGSGFTVIYGVAAPVKPPRIGVVKGY